MALPREDPDPSLIELAQEGLGELWEPLAVRLAGLEGAQRRLALWLIAAETRVITQLGWDEEINGLQLLAFGVESLDGDLSPQITAYVLPQAVGDNRERDLALGVPDETGLYVHVETVVEPWELTLQAPLNLRYATLGCWVKPMGGGEAILTVRHAVANGRVNLDDGTVQPVLWYAPDCLDAAVAGAPAGRSPAGAPAGRSLTALSAAVPAVGDTVDVMAKGAAQARRVHKVGRTYGTVTAAIPHTFLLDQPLQSGDSGSLVRLSGGGDALGLYIGALTTSKGPRGFCQGLSQLERLFHNANLSSGFYEE